MIKPQDFLTDFSPDNKAELYLHVIDDRSIFEKNKIFKIVFSLFRPIFSVLIILKRDFYLKNLQNSVKKKYGKRTVQTLKKYIANAFKSDHLRKFEYNFLADCLLRPGVNTDIIVDFGGGGSFSTYVPVLFRIPFKKLLSFDVMNIPLKSSFSIEYINADCTKTGLPSRSVDVVTIISTLEHIGLGRYGDPLQINGDIKAMREAYRILKKDGTTVLTIPYGYPTVVFNMHRVYDRGRFELLAKNFKKVIVRYSLNGKISERSRAERKKVSKQIKGYYRHTPIELRPPDSQAGILALLRKI